MIATSPRLDRIVHGGIAVWTDLALRERGVVVCFSERGGGASKPPYSSLNLASHVGDSPQAVDANRQRLLEMVGLGYARHRLITAEQVHGALITVVDGRDGGRGAFAAYGAEPVAQTDGLATGDVGLPLLLCFADCVPVVLVSPGPWIAVVHAGWRGALDGIAGAAAMLLAQKSGCDTREISAYLGAHINACHYEVGDEILSQFVDVFGTVARAESGGLDLGSVVPASLRSAGVDPCNIASLGYCTAETTDRFFSHRAEAGLTGRHSALACILS